VGALPAIAAATTAAATTTTATATTVSVIATATTAAAAVITTAATAIAATAATIATTPAAATTAIATTATPPEPTAATTAAALLALLGLIDAQRTTIEGTTIHSLDCLGGLLGSSHGHEREAAGAAGLAIRDQVDIAYGPEFLERSTDAFSIGIEREVSNVQTSIHRLLDLAQVTNVPPRGGHGAPSGGFQNEKMLLQTPTEHRTKTDELWQVRSYSSQFAIATWKVGWGLTVEKLRDKMSETRVASGCPMTA
jgi:hypothetical protein